MGSIPSNLVNSFSFFDFSSDIRRSGILQSSRFVVTFKLPQFLAEAYKVASNGVDINKSLSFRCSNISIPGRSYSTLPYRFHGPARNMAYEQIFAGELEMTFILSGQLEERKFFENWMDLISSRQTYKMAYYDSYISDMEIHALNTGGEAVYGLELLEVYPRRLSDISMSYDRENEIMTQNVVMSFRKYTPTGTNLYADPSDIKFGSSDEQPSTVPTESLAPESIWAKEQTKRAEAEAIKKDLEQKAAFRKKWIDAETAHRAQIGEKAYNEQINISDGQGGAVTVWKNRGEADRGDGEWRSSQSADGTYKNMRAVSAEQISGKSKRQKGETWSAMFAPEEGSARASAPDSRSNMPQERAKERMKDFNNPKQDGLGF